jgi:hypothetical protein
MSVRIYSDVCRDTATWACWNMTGWPWLTTLAPILISPSFSRTLGQHTSLYLIDPRNTRPGGLVIGSTGKIKD